jgi:hypothetical protein
MGYLGVEYVLETACKKDDDDNEIDDSRCTGRDGFLQ